MVFDADRLTTAQMQAVAREFNYSETTFVCTPDDPAADHKVRIFTPTFEMPFAGHPNVGTGYALALADAAKSAFIFEEIAGLVPVAVSRAHGRIHVEITAPEPLEVGPEVEVATVADVLGLELADIATHVHSPRAASVGAVFTVVELASRDALSRIRVTDAAKLATLPGLDSIYAYTRDATDGADVSARMIFDADGLVEDPATGSATAACAALLHSLMGESGLVFAQGIDMGRPSRVETRVDGDGVHIGGTCVPVMEGTITV